MFLKNGTIKTHPAGRAGLWVAAVALVAAALVPSACVLWFMNAAMRNERLAVRQRLTDVYRQRLADATVAIDELWRSRLDAMAQAAQMPAAAAFDKLVRMGMADSIVIRASDGRDGYPGRVRLPSQDVGLRSPRWAEAEQIEHELAQPARAAEIYAAIAESADNADACARALQAQSRCLAKSGDKAGALKILTGILAADEFANCRDAHGRLISINSNLMAMQLIGDPKAKKFSDLADALTRRLGDYGDTDLDPAQRRFAMEVMAGLVSSTPLAAHLAAERLAEVYLQTVRTAPDETALTSASGGELWHIADPSGRVVAIFRTESLLSEMNVGAGLDESFAGASLRLVAPSPQAAESEAFLTVPAGSYLPRWRLEVHLAADPFIAAVRQQNVLYLWTAAIGIFAIAAGAMIVGVYLRRQVRLTRLKNDLVATVTHELKTPLASMRVLVDTLVEGRCNDDQQARDYFGLIARENERLSRLIDNFLAFSRMERNKCAFDRRKENLRSIVEAAAAVVSDRFNSPGCSLEIDVSETLPPVTVDKDAMVTVFVNLFENAWKYSEDEKHVVVRASAAGQSIRVDVRDNGIGMSRRAARRVFKRFYQVDQTLTRRVGGCGLGLSIARFILDAHGATIDVSSSPGEGSIFTITIPVEKPNGRRQENERNGG